MNDAEQVPPGVDPSIPSPARMYDRYLGGTANFQADRDAVDRIMDAGPRDPRCCLGEPRLPPARGAVDG
jgi:hypothetical protein